LTRGTQIAKKRLKINATADRRQQRERRRKRQTEQQLTVYMVINSSAVTTYCHRSMLALTTRQHGFTSPSPSPSSVCSYPCAIRHPEAGPVGHGAPCYAVGGLEPPGGRKTSISGGCLLFCYLLQTSYI